MLDNIIFLSSYASKCLFNIYLSKVLHAKEHYLLRILLAYKWCLWYRKSLWKDFPSLENVNEYFTSFRMSLQKEKKKTMIEREWKRKRDKKTNFNKKQK